MDRYVAWRQIRSLRAVTTTASIASFVTTRGWLVFSKDDDQVWPRHYSLQDLRVSLVRKSAHTSLLAAGRFTGSITTLEHTFLDRKATPDGTSVGSSRRLSNFQHHELDVRDRSGVMNLIDQVRPAAIVHSAAQPSHDLAAKIPFEDFDTNAVGTINLLEAAHRFVPSSPFVHMSTNKVYGDAPNELPLVETDTRWEYARPEDRNGIRESMRIDQSKHSLFGASKVAADVMVQEYGRYFGMMTCCLRGGCLTGPNHSGVELHGFLSYLVKCNVQGRKYSVYGYKGKQVRDNIHSVDVVRFIECFIEAPRSGEVYNLGGGRGNSCSILEAFQLAERGLRQEDGLGLHRPKSRGRPHLLHQRFVQNEGHYPSWDISKSLDDIFSEIHRAWLTR